MSKDRVQPPVSAEVAKTSFLRKLLDTEQWLEQQQIPFRILGSLALHTYTDFPLIYNREERIGFQRVPDIDLLIPRSNLPEVGEYRKRLLQGDVPVNLELFSTHIHLDFRPEEDQSYLTHKRLRTPVPSELFQPVTRYIEQTPIVTVPPQTLFHTFVVCGGTLRHKDWDRILPLGRHIKARENEFTETDYTNFHAFLRARKQQYPLDTKMMWFAQTQLPKVPPALYHFAWDKMTPLVERYYRRK